jgi:molecular chaperone HtpG
MSEATVDSSRKDHAFKAETQQVLHILAHSLYTDREIFLRELLSNASDAINRVQFALLTEHDAVDAAAEPLIRVSMDKDARTLTISDNGIGMTEQEMIDHLGTIAQSSARRFVQQAKEGGQAQASEIIGQFGVGFYAVFMVADRVVVESRSYRPEAQAARWESIGGAGYSVEPSEKTERGTTITLHLKEDAGEFADSWRIEQVIKRHSNYVAFPIMIEERQINARTAIWRKAPREVSADEYKDYYRQLTFESDAPLTQLHLSTDAPIDLHAILYVPAKRERGMLARRVEGTIKLYSRKVLILEEAKELLPSYFRFIEGVVDSEDLPLNVSRESVQSGNGGGSPVMQRIKKTLTGRLHKELNELAERDAAAYQTFWTEFGPFIKEGIASDYESRNDLLKLLRVQTTTSGEELTTLAAYKQRMLSDQKAIYYVLAAGLEAARNSPHLDPFKARNIEVVLFNDLMDGYLLTGLRDFDGVPLQNIDEADLELPGEVEQQTPLIDDTQFSALAERLAALLGGRIKEVRASQVLRDNPARMVAESDDFGREMQRLQAMLGREQEAAAPRILELNPAHPLVAALAQRAMADAEDPLLALAAEQLYDNTLLIEGLHKDPAAMVPRILQLLTAAAQNK